MKSYFTFILSLLFLSGCMKDNNTVNEPTIDWETYKYVMHWTEIESKTDESGWKNISEGQKLTFFSNFVDEKLGLPNNGKVLYKPELSINIKNNTSFKRNDNTFKFYYFSSKAKADTVFLSYKLLDSSTLVISNTNVTPIVEIKYRRDN
ncbi:MAG: hypothetical protein Q8910_09285 [Bacteroidota bacterium]|nr:hypothetical protein [Bacteroidota bacterium]